GGGGCVLDRGGDGPRRGGAGGHRRTARAHHRNRRGTALRWAGAGAARPPRPLLEPGAEAREALRGPGSHDPRGAGGLRGGGARRRLPRRGEHLPPARPGGPGRLVREAGMIETADLERIAARALAEDVGPGDVTTLATVPAGT